MTLCVKCGKKRKTNSPNRVICWDDYCMCADCCIKLHPERYSLNIINQYLGIAKFNQQTYYKKNKTELKKKNLAHYHAKKT